jgi:hypothetical protein
MPGSKGHNFPDPPSRRDTQEPPIIVSLCAGQGGLPRPRSRYEPLVSVGKSATIKKVKYIVLTHCEAAALRSNV